MIRQSVDSLLGTVLLTALLPLVLLSQLREFLKSARPRRTCASVPAHAPAAVVSPAIGEFDFDRVIEAYERLLDEQIEEASR